MTERASILSRLADQYEQLALARRALETCRESERLSIRQSVYQINCEIAAGKALLAKMDLPPPPTVGEASPGVSNPAARPAASLLSTWKEGT